MPKNSGRSAASLMQIQTVSRSTDAAGKVTVSYVNVSGDAGKIWATIEALTGREFMDAQQLKDTVSHRIRTRYHTAIVPTSRLTWNSRTFNIVWVEKGDDRGRLIDVMCMEEV